MLKQFQYSKRDDQSTHPDSTRTGNRTTSHSIVGFHASNFLVNLVVVNTIYYQHTPISSSTRRRLVCYDSCDSHEADNQTK